MNVTRLLAGIALPLTTLSGCATHPLPIDFTGKHIVSIVNNVRCEAYFTILDRVVQVLKESGVQSSIELARRLENEELHLRDVQTFQVDKKSDERISRFKEAGINMSFKFMITEKNDNSIDGTFKVPFTKDTFSLGVKAGHNRQRVSERNLTIGDTFSELVLAANCKRHNIPAASPGYPVTGSIGLKEVISTFLAIAKQGVDTQKLKSKTSGATLESYTDKVTFTTKLNGSIAPNLELAPVTKKFKLTQLKGTFGAVRIDVHEVLVTLVVPDHPAPPTSTLKIKLRDNVVLNVTVPPKYGQRRRVVQQVVSPKPKNQRKVQESRRKKKGGRFKRGRLKGKFNSTQSYFTINADKAARTKRKADRERRRQQDLDSNANRTIE